MLGFLEKAKSAAASDIKAIDEDLADSLAGMLEGKIEAETADDDEVVSLARKDALDSHEYHQGEIDRLTKEIARAHEIAAREVAWREKRLAQHQLVVDAISAYEDVIDRHQVEQGKAGAEASDKMPGGQPPAAGETAREAENV